MGRLTGKNRSPRAGKLKPYFERDGVVLFHADALDVLPLLPAGSVAAAITDPPYNSGGQSMGERSRDPRDKYCQNNNDCGRPSFAGDNRDQRSFAFWATLWMRMLRRVVREDGYCLAFSDWRQLPTMTDVLQAAGFTWRGVVPWNKGRGARAPHKGYFRHQCEYVVWGTNGRCRKAEHAGPFDGCVECSVRKSDKFHMTGKPTDLMRQLVEVVPPGEVIIDPFAGSGTTGVACLQAGRRCILIEQSAAYCAIAADRLAQSRPTI